MPNADPCANLPTDWETISPGTLFALIACGANMAIQGFGPIVRANPSDQTVQNPQGSTMVVDADVPAKGSLGVGVGVGIAIGVAAASALTVYLVLNK